MHSGDVLSVHTRVSHPKHGTGFWLSPLRNAYANRFNSEIIFGP